MFGIGGGELIFIIFIALMLFGTDKIPEAARTFGKVMANLKHATNEIKTEIQKSADVEEINSSFKQVTSSFTEEVDKVKESVSVTPPDFTSNTLTDATSGINEIKEDLESLTGPIKRQRVMLEKIIAIDKDLLVFLNGLGSEAFDGFWLIITKQVYWTPYFLLVFYFLAKKIGWKNFIIALVFIALLILVSDQNIQFFLKIIFNDCVLVMT